MTHQAVNNQSPLITLQEIADMHGCDVRRAREIIVRHPGFPAPARTSTPRNRVWVRAEVVEFLVGSTQTA